MLGWRDLPIDASSVGSIARSAMPGFHQVFVASPAGHRGLALERRAFILRKRIEHDLADVYFASLSARTVVYKGMLTAPQVEVFFPELGDERFESALALVHSRFSTNTFPSWPLAHPYRYLAHNGEINTLQGNRNWMRAREDLLASDLFPGELGRIFPVITPAASDSASFDEVLELLHLGGRSLPHAVLMMIPEAWEQHRHMDPAKRAFYQFHAALMEPWDGPASIAFTDGTVIGAVLDRNGLRPSRYWVTDDGLVVMASEVGVLDIEPARVVARGRLQPGRMFLVDTAKGRIVADEEIKSALAAEHPYSEWLARKQIHFDDLAPRFPLTPQHASVLAHQRLFGYTTEDLKVLLAPMSETGYEPIGSMGTDTPIAVLSERPRLLYDYFQQLFAQVTNPPLDAIREELVTSLASTIGPERNLLAPEPDSCNQIVMPRPVLTNEELAKLLYINEDGTQPGWHTFAVDGLFPVGAGRARPGPGPGPGRPVRTRRRRHRGRRQGHRVVRPALVARPGPHPGPAPRQRGPSPSHPEKDPHPRGPGHRDGGGPGGAPHGPPSRLRRRSHQSISGLRHHHRPDRRRRAARRHPPPGHPQLHQGLRQGRAQDHVQDGDLDRRLVYRGPGVRGHRTFADAVVDAYFTGTVSRIGGIGLDEIAAEVLARHARAFPSRPSELAHRELDGGGEYQWRREGEFHLFNPTTVHKLQHATRTRRYDIFKQYTAAVDDQSARLGTLRGLFRVRTAGEIGRQPVPLDEVEPVSAIVKRFSTGAMSYGSISAEAHETLAIAMNRIGGRSNTGEGGEDAERYVPDPNGDLRRSAIKQVASGRFGVTSEYLVNADDLQIKMAQGAKPGEGGQLPGHKVYPWIAKTRHSTPGVGLISPPPHHDIYSIEDLAQLIYDLKNANDAARIHVKLVAEVGVGTVAAGVSKAHADVVLISGHDGGTGASPLNSLKHAGVPWELGLAETQQTLMRNRLRDRIVVQVDGQLKTGRDVLIAALLGAEEYGFATAPLVVSGCVMMRVCHLDTCPVGIATQNPELRKRFTRPAGVRRQLLRVHRRGSPGAARPRWASAHWMRSSAIPS